MTGNCNVVTVILGEHSLDAIDKIIIERALEITSVGFGSGKRFNVTAAAKLLRTTRETMRYRMRKYGIKQKWSGKTNVSRNY